MKKIIVLIAAAILVLGLATIAFAASTASAAAAVPTPGASAGYGCGGAGAVRGCLGLMWDSDGNFLSKEAYGEKLDEAVTEGLILAEDKEAYLEIYDYCNENGGKLGVRRGCGMNRGW